MTRPPRPVWTGATASRAQLRAARGLLGISQQELADLAGMSLMTVKRAEGAAPRGPTPASLGALVSALERAGVEFLGTAGDREGVRQRQT